MLELRLQIVIFNLDTAHYKDYQKNNLLYDHITFNNWDQLSKVSPSVNEIIHLIHQQVYTQWIPTSCGAIRDQGFNVDQYSSCPHEMAIGFVLFALNDVLWQAGYQKPDAISQFMKRMSNEIDSACDTKKIDCNPKPPSVMPAQIHILKSDLNGLFKKFTKSLDLIINYGGASWDHYKADRDIIKLLSMREKLRVFLLGPLDPPLNTNFHIQNDDFKRNVKKGNFGYIDSVSYSFGSLQVQGWAILDENNKFSSVDIYINNEIKCDIALTVKRPDISKLYPENIGFSCTFPLEITKDSTFLITSYAKLNQDKYNKYLLNNTDVVDISMSNIFNEGCYLKYNPDVEKAVNQGIITALSHWELDGMREKRTCMPIFNSYTDYSGYYKKVNEYGYIKNDTFKASYSTSLVFYRYLVLFSLIILIPCIFLTLKNKNYLFTIVIGTFLILAITRVVLVSILSYLALVPISPLYLMSGIYSLFIACLTATIISIFYFLKIIIKPKEDEYQI